MVVPGGMDWRLPAVSDAVIEDKIRHVDSIGTVELHCPACAAPRQMHCYRFRSGLFGDRRALHFVCPSCGGTWTVDKSETEKVLAAMRPIDGSGQVVP